MGTFGADRDAYLAVDDTYGDLEGQMVLEDPEVTYYVNGGCEQTSDGYANFWFRLVPGGEPYFGTIYEADDGYVYIEGRQDSTGYRFVLVRQ